MDLMPASIRLRVTGDDAIRRALRRMTPDQNDAIVRDPFEAWAARTAAISKTQYLSGPRPRVLGVVSGFLRSSIEPSRYSFGKVEVGTHIIYGPTHEFGDPSRNIPARPFLMPAAEEASEKLERELSASWQRQLQ